MSDHGRFVCALDELAPGTMRQFDLDDVPLVVCRSEATGEVLALQARCPHQGALLCRGKLTGVTLGMGGREVVVRRGEVVRCPAHGWDFDARTGSTIGMWPAWHARTYTVRVRDGGIYVSP